jgi:hypothetical protein
MNWVSFSGMSPASPLLNVPAEVTLMISSFVFASSLYLRILYTR